MVQYKWPTYCWHHALPGIRAKPTCASRLGNAASQGIGMMGYFTAQQALAAGMDRSTLAITLVRRGVTSVHAVALPASALPLELA